MTTREIEFMATKEDSIHIPLPYIRGQEPIAYVCDGSEGSIRFNGYYYVENTPPPYPEDETLPSWERPRRHDTYLPKTLMMYTKLRETEPYKIEENEERTCTTRHYATIEEHLYKIEIYRKEIHECTDEISEIEDDDGSPMRVCFFPTNEQTIYFRILERG